MKELGFRLFVKEENGQVFEIASFGSLLNITFDACHYVQMDEATPKEVSKAAGFVCKWIWNLYQRMMDERRKNHRAELQKQIDQYAVSDLELISSLVNQQKGENNE